jgi:hypothetical protein
MKDACLPHPKEKKRENNKATSRSPARLMIALSFGIQYNYAIHLPIIPNY